MVDPLQSRRGDTVTDKIAYTAAEAAELVGLSESGIRNLVRDGKLRRVPDTGRLIIARAELERWVNSEVAA